MTLSEYPVLEQEFMKWYKSKFKLDIKEKKKMFDFNIKNKQFTDYITDLMFFSYKSGKIKGSKGEN